MSSTSLSSGRADGPHPWLYSAWLIGDLRQRISGEVLPFQDQLMAGFALTLAAPHHGPVSTARASSFLNAAGTMGGDDQRADRGGPAGAAGPDAGLPCRVAAVEQAGRERTRALVSARA